MFKNSVHIFILELCSNMKTRCANSVIGLGGLGGCLNCCWCRRWLSAVTSVQNRAMCLDCCDMNSDSNNNLSFNFEINLIHSVVSS
jgi:hypothetical protein